MTINFITGLVGFVILAAIVVSILFATGTIKTKNASPSPIKKVKPYTHPPENTDSAPYITPTPFKVGYLKNSPQPLADVCNSTMYPVQPPYVEYGPWNGGDCCNGNCDVNIFNSQP